MPLIISGIISISYSGCPVSGWNWNLTEIDPASVFGRQPKVWKAEWDTADTGGPMDQYCSYAKFTFDGPLPDNLIRYLLAADTSEAELIDICVELNNLSSNDIEYLKSRLNTPLPDMKGNEVYKAYFDYSREKICEKLSILREDKLLFSEKREITIRDKQFISEDTIFISDDNHSYPTIYGTG